MAIPLDAAAAAMREAMRETVKRYSIWYLLQGILMVVAGVLALVYPLIASVAIVRLLGWILIITGVLHGIGLIGARQVPQFWLELLSVVLAIVVGLLLLRQPQAGLAVFSALLIVYFMVEGIAKVIFGADHQAIPELGLGLGERPHRHPTCSLSLGQFCHDFRMDARLYAWHLARLRGAALTSDGVARPRGRKSCLESLHWPRYMPSSDDPVSFSMSESSLHGTNAVHTSRRCSSV